MSLREPDPSWRVEYDSPEFEDKKYKEKKWVTVKEGKEDVEIITREFNEQWIRATAANWKTGAMLFPDRSKIERELSPDSQELKDW